MTASEIIAALMQDRAHTLEDRIQSWKDIAMKCEAKLRTELDPASQAFNSAILKIANLELTQAVRERMNQ